MSGNLVEFLKLYQGTSQTTGKTYFRGRMNGLKLVGFMVDAKEGEDAHVQIYIDTGEPKPAASSSSSLESYGDSKRASYGSSNGAGYRGGKARAASKPKVPEQAAPFNDQMPFGEWTP